MEVNQEGFQHAGYIRAKSKSREIRMTDKKK